MWQPWLISELLLKSNPLKSETERTPTFSTFFYCGSADRNRPRGSGLKSETEKMYRKRARVSELTEIE